MTNQQDYIKESEKTKRAREKLKKRLNSLEQEITQEALKKKIIEIHDRITRHSSSRTILSRKTISLFDNNQNAAKISNKVNSIYQKMKVSNVSLFQDIKYSNTESSEKEWLSIIFKLS